MNEIDTRYWNTYGDTPDRRYEPDERDAFYNGETLIKKTHIRSKYWPSPAYTNPTNKYSVGVAWYNWYQGQKNKLPEQKFFISPLDFLYKEGDLDNGTIRGGAKFLHKNKLIRAYYWTQDVDVLANYILNYGPAVVGTEWTLGMANPERETGYIQDSGYVVNSYAYVVDGVNLSRNMFRLKPHAGSSWGRDGRAYLPYEDLRRLLTRDSGEACLPVGFGKKWKP